MKFDRLWLRRVSLAAFISFFTSWVCAQSTFPAKQIRIVTPFASGGSADTVARVLARELGVQWGVPVIVENKPGAGGNIGAEAVVRSAGDGTTFLLSGAALPINVALNESVPYELMKTLIPVSHIADLPIVIAVNSKLPINSLDELIDYARKNPGVLNFASAGNGTMGHVSGELFKYKAKVNVVHVPYKGVPAATIDLGEGRIHFMIDALPIVLSTIQQDKARAIATTGKKRLAMYPNLPTALESGMDMENSSWLSLWAPKGTPTSVIAKVSKDVATALGSADVRSVLEKQGFEIVGGSPEDLTALVKRDLDKWTKVVQAAGIKGN